MDQLQGYREQTATMDRDAFLGRLCWYEVTETAFKHTDLVERMTAAGLDDFIPDAPRDDDVFRRVFHNGQRKKVETGDSEVIVNYLIRELSRAEGKISKRVVIEQVDRRGRRLDYSEALEITFDNSTPDKVKVSPLGGGLDTTAIGLVSDLAERYRRSRGTVNGDGVRRLISRILDSSLATSVRAGVYFVMEERADKVDAVEQLGAVIPGCDVHSLELIDTGKQRDMLRKAFEAESVEEIDRMMAEIANIPSDEKVTPAKAKAYAERYAALRSKADEYSRLLSQSLDTTNFRLRLFEKHMASLSQKVSTERKRRSA